MKLAEYIEVNNSKEYIIHIPKSDRKIEKKLFTKEELLNQRYMDYPIMSIDNLLNGNVKITLDETELKEYECVFNIEIIKDKIKKEFKYTLIVDAFDKEEAELRGKFLTFKEYISQGKKHQLIIDVSDNFISIDDIKCISINLIKDKKRVKHTNVKLEDFQNWLSFESPIKYRDKVYANHNYHIDDGALLVINETLNEKVRISNKNNLFTVIDYSAYIEILD